MESKTPEVAPGETLTLDQFGYGGNGLVMIWALTGDPDKGLNKPSNDEEMIGMANKLQRLLDRQGKFAGRINSNGEPIKGIGVKLALGRSLYVTGHSRFKRANGTIIPIPDRYLGNYPVDAVINELILAVQTHALSYIELWCCESACTVGGNLNGGANKEVRQEFNYEALKAAKAKFKTGQWAHLSTLDYLCFRMATELMKVEYIQYDLKVTGLSGVGYITESDPYIRTFDQLNNLDMVNRAMESPTLEKRQTIKSRAVQAKSLKEQEDKRSQADAKLERDIKARSCHYVVSHIDTGALKTERMLKREKKEERKKKEAKEAMTKKGPDDKSGGPGKDSSGPSGGSHVVV